MVFVFSILVFIFVVVVLFSVYPKIVVTFVAVFIRIYHRSEFNVIQSPEQIFIKKTRSISTLSHFASCFCCVCIPMCRCCIVLNFSALTVLCIRIHAKLAYKLSFKSCAHCTHTNPMNFFIGENFSKNLFAQWFIAISGQIEQDIPTKKNRQKK